MISFEQLSTYQQHVVPTNSTWYLATPIVTYQQHVVPTNTTCYLATPRVTHQQHVLPQLQLLQGDWQRSEYDASTSWNRGLLKRSRISSSLAMLLSTFSTLHVTVIKSSTAYRIRLYRAALFFISTFFLFDLNACILLRTENRYSKNSGGGWYTLYMDEINVWKGLYGFIFRNEVGPYSVPWYLE